MATSSTRFEDMYKNSLRAEMLQIERRHKLLELQRLQRSKELDKHRKIIDQLREFQSGPKSSYRYRNQFRNVLQMSEWMHEMPDDLENWYLVPCPKGIRCLLVADNGRTEAIDKTGRLILSFSSTLPGGFPGQRKDTTIIDAFFDKESGRFYALDLLAYNSQDYMNCDCEFRFFWLNSKIDDDDLSVDSKRRYPIIPIPFAKFTDPLAIDKLLGKHPMWPNENPKLDGLLFYHKESNYISGRTPLVLWLFPFMVPEVLGIVSVHDKYVAQKPTHYKDYKQYISDFESKKEKKQAKLTKRRLNPQQMDIQESENTESIVEAPMMQDELDERQKLEQDMFLLETGN